MQQCWVSFETAAPTMSFVFETLTYTGPYVFFVWKLLRLVYIMIFSLRPKFKSFEARILLAFKVSCTR